jgi:hypothetical protein
MDVHHEVADGAAGTELDLGVPAAHARESIDAVNDDFVSVTSYALDGDGVIPEAGDETVPLLLAALASESRDCGEEERGEG